MANIFKDKTTIVFAIFAIFFVVSAVIGGVRMYSPVPAWDMWNGYLGFYFRVTEGDWSAWWELHNEHRIVLARLLFWIDISVFQGRGWFLIVVNYLSLAATCLIFWSIQKEVKQNKDIWIGLFLVAWLFAWIQENNLTWGFQSQFILAQLLPLVALFLMHKSAKLHRESSCFTFGMAVMFGLLSAGSLASGLLTLPLMTIYSLFTRMGYIRVALLAGFSIIVFTAYFFDYHSPDRHGSLMQVLKYHPIELLHYLLLYLGGPFYYFFGSGDAGRLVASIAGVFMIASCLVFSWRILPEIRTSTLRLTLLFFILYIGGTAFATGGARLLFGIDQALSSRYMTPALMAWAALLLLYLPKIDTLQESTQSKIRFAFMFLIILMVPQQLKSLSPKHDVLFERIVASLALELGIKDQAQIGHVFPYEWVVLISERAVKQNVSVFGIPPIKDVREHLGKKLQIEENIKSKCLGHIDEVEVVVTDPGYVRVRGWVFDTNTRIVPDFFYIVDKFNVIRGGVVTGQPRPDVANRIDMAAGLSGFKGYFQLKEQGSSIILKSVENNCTMDFELPSEHEVLN